MKLPQINKQTGQPSIWSGKRSGCFGKCKNTPQKQRAATLKRIEQLQQRTGA